METTGDDIRDMTQAEIFEELKHILKKTAPLKIIEEITPQSSLIDDFAFDSIDVMGMMLEIKEQFLKDKSIDVDGFLNEAYKNNDGKVFSVETICWLIQNSIKGEHYDGTKD